MRRVSDPAIKATDVAADVVGNVVIDEPIPRRRIRQPIDLIRLVLAMLGLLAIAAIASVAVQTSSGLEEDITEGTTSVPSWIIDSLSVVIGIALLAVPIVILVDQLVRNRAQWILDLILAGALGGIVAAVLNWALRLGATEDLVLSMTVPLAGGERSVPLTPFLCGLAAFAAAADHGSRRWITALIWATFGGYAIVVLAGQRAGVLGVAATLLLGRVIGLSIRYAFGVPNTRPHGAALVSYLHDAGLDPAHIVAEPSADDVRHYLVTTTVGDRLNVRVLDRDQQGAGYLYRIYRRLRLQSPVTRRATLSLHAAVEREVLMTRAAAAAGVRTPKLVAGAPAGADGALIAYEHVDGRRLDQLPAADVDDGLLRQAWTQLAAARASHVAVRGITNDQLLVDDAQRLWFLDVRSGEVAANQLQLRHDAAQLLATTALLAGPQRAAAAAVDTLGQDGTGAALPLLQPIALHRKIRAKLRSRRTLLPEVREAVLKRVSDPAVAPVRIERLRPRTIVSIIGGAIGAYYLMSALASVDLVGLVTGADVGWAAVTLAFAMLTFVGAAISLMGFVPIRLPLVETVLAQFAASFAKLVAPASVGSVALNTRFVQKAGLEPALALASVGVAQVFAFVLYVGLLLTFGLLTGTTADDTSVLPSEAIVVALAVAAGLAIVSMAVRPLRRWIMSKVQPTLARVLPRLLDMLQSPVKLAQGVGGNLLLTVAFIVALYASVQAFGGSVSFVTLAVVYMAGAALGSAAPTPGGLGAVEAALAGGLTAAGLPGGTAVSAVLLFRVATFWLPVIPGWLAFHVLQRRDAL